jgi:hypothetical protein
MIPNPNNQSCPRANPPKFPAYWSSLFAPIWYPLLLYTVSRTIERRNRMASGRRTSAATSRGLRTFWAADQSRSISTPLQNKVTFAIFTIFFSNGTKNCQLKACCIDVPGGSCRFPGTACGSLGFRHAHLRSAIHSRTSEFNET